ncbi:PREDICTED: uncharacterized protein LOC108661410 [Theobroma cacao]|uniref:Uncharacterized protein LOC108661410 n=1 Tax=Theobroma cacao TaxID=3641 RepID=A0AB32W6I8_THECC|nr:PREDICTED: uncharacterized protein LOC108661410 [Theobroma cacao]
MVESCRLLCLTSVYVVYVNLPLFFAPDQFSAVTDMFYCSYYLQNIQYNRFKSFAKRCCIMNMENKALQDAVVDCARSTHHDASESCCYCNQHRVAKALTRVLRFVCVDMGICS